jgi:outer membrane protein OmpA-like peptidoglycan-associated protein
MHLPSKDPTAMTFRWLLTFGAIVLASAGGIAQGPASGPAAIPLCPGLTIVTSISQPQGDYESIKRIEAVTPERVRIKYSSYMPDPNSDYEPANHDATGRHLGTGQIVAPPPWVPFTVLRTVRTADLASSASYLQQFAPKGVPETVNGTTALGISTASFRELRDKGRTSLTIYQTVNPAIGLKDDGSSTMFGVDYRLPGELVRVDRKPVMVSVLVNDRVTELPALHARGKFLHDDSEFYFLYDEANPIALKFRIGLAQASDPDAAKLLESIPELKKMYGDPAMQQLLAKQNRDRDVLQVVKLSTRCETPSSKPAGSRGGVPGGGGGLPAGGYDGGRSGTGGGGAANAIEESLTKTGRADIYSIYFAFNSDQLREESEPTLQEIAEVLRRHPDWKLAIEGHTDNVATDAYNLQLSQRRSAAVRNALVSGKGIAGARLTTAGLGESRPKDTNDTLEGRARNRRVELVRVP